MRGDLQVGEWRAQPSLNRLQRDDRIVRLEPKVMQVLECLAEHAGEVVSRDMLVARVWPDVHVSDDVLHRAVGELRRAFGDEATRPAYIETIRKRGYRLIAPVERGDIGRAAEAKASALRTEGEASSTPPMGSRVGRTTIIAAAMLLAGIALGVVDLATRPSSVATQASPRFVPLAAGPSNETDPALSPDGQRLAYVSRPGGAATQADIFIVDTPGATPRRWTTSDADDRLPAWRPDGGAVAFVRMSGSSCEVLVRPIDETTETRVGMCGNAEEPRLAWSADGRWLVSSLAAGPVPNRGWQIVKVGVASGERVPLTEPSPTGSRDHSPTIAPNGRDVAFIRAISGGVSDVYVVSINGGAARRVTHDAGDLVGLDWTDDGRSLVYASDRAGSYSLWTIAASGGAAHLLAGGSAKLKHPSSSRRGSRVAYESWSYEINLWDREFPSIGGVDSAGESRPDDGVSAVDRPLGETSDLWNYHPQPSPDDRLLAFVSTRSGAHEVWVSARDGSSPRQLTRFGRASVRAPQWSPDGSRLVVSAIVAEEADLYLIDVLSGRTTPLTHSVGDEVAPAWSRDGRDVYFGAKQHDRWQIWKVDVDGRVRHQLTEDGGYAAQPSADGAWLYFTRADQSGLWRQPIGGGPATLIGDHIPAGDWANWRVGVFGVYFVGWTRATGPMLRVMHLDGSGPRDLAPLIEWSWPGIALSRDESHVLYARATRKESNILALDR
jgi:Tol biopolymer transport system component/DNA-binding winged helix-turn-helix (wHTH) protein